MTAGEALEGVCLRLEQEAERWRKLSVDPNATFVWKQICQELANAMDREAAVARTVQKSVA